MGIDHEKLRQYFFTTLGWGDIPHSHHVFSFLIEAAEAASGGAVLDAGAGHQRYKPFFEDAMYIAQEHPLSGVEAKKINEFDILCDVRTIPLQDNCIRVVFSTSSLEHMRDPGGFIMEAHRVLEPGGKLFIQVPFVYLEHEKPYDFQRPTSFGLQRWFDDAGFTSSDIKPASSSLYTTVWAALMALDEEEKLVVGGTLKQYRAKRAFAKARQALNDLKQYDHAPGKDAQFPIAWTAVAVKSGEPTRQSIGTDKRDFLETRRLAHTRFEDGTLYVSEF